MRVVHEAGGVGLASRGSAWIVYARTKSDKIVNKKYPPDSLSAVRSYIELRLLRCGPDRRLDDEIDALYRELAGLLQSVRIQMSLSTLTEL